MAQELLELAPAFRRRWPFRPRFARVNGWRMHYVDEGRVSPFSFPWQSDLGIPLPRRHRSARGVGTARYSSRYDGFGFPRNLRESKRIRSTGTSPIS